MSRPTEPTSAPEPTRPQRVRVTAPRRTTGRRRAPRTAATEIDAQTEVGTIFLRSLLRAQLRLAAGILALLGVVVGGLPLLFGLFPEASATHVAGMPLAWLVLAVAIYPVLVALGLLFVSRAERNERAFTDVVEGS